MDFANGILYQRASSFNVDQFDKKFVSRTGINLYRNAIKLVLDKNGEKIYDLLFNSSKFSDQIDIEMNMFLSLFQGDYKDKVSRNLKEVYGINLQSRV